MKSFVCAMSRSGACDPDRSRQAMDAVDEHLVRRRDGLVHLLAGDFWEIPGIQIKDGGGLASGPEGEKRSDGYMAWRKTTIAQMLKESGVRAEVCELGSNTLLQEFTFRK